MESLNVIIAALVTVLYLIVALKLLLAFFHKITQPLNTASGILLTGVLIGFGINLNDFSEIAVSSFFYYAKSNNLLIGIGFWFLFAFLAFIFSYVLFRFSFQMINWATPENEKAELGKNNIVLGILHGVSYIILCFVLSDSITILANTLINYPTVPN